MADSANRRYSTRIRDVSDQLLIGFHILFTLAKEGKQVAVLSNKFLQKYFKMSKVYDKRLNAFAADLNHLFNHRISRDRQGRRILKFSLNDEFDKPSEPFNTFPNLEEIEESLRIQIYRISVDKE